MVRRLPPLNALRAFESAARHLSFTKAAEELFVTQSAISRHIKSLESYLGMTLFEREPGRLRLTPVAERMLPSITGAFDRIGAAIERAVADQRDLKIKVMPTFAIRWLIPRLARFQSQHSEFQVRLTTAWSEVSFEREEFDLGIVFDYIGPTSPELKVDLILIEQLVPLCAPTLLEQRRPLATPGDLRHFTLLHPNPSHREWRAWLTQANVETVDPDTGIDFDIDETAFQAAIGGHGVALGNPLLVANDLTAGRLVIPFDLPPLEIGGYYLLCPTVLMDQPKVEAFRCWLLAEVAEG